MNIAEKIKQDWNRRAQHHARYWIVSEDFQNEMEEMLRELNRCGFEILDTQSTRGPTDGTDVHAPRSHKYRSPMSHDV